MRPLYQALASKVAARKNCMETGKDEWFYRHQADADVLVKEHMPSGGGFDAGTSLDWDKSTADRLVFKTSFHHMNDAGMYDGWTEHAVTVRASLMHGFDVTISGRDRNQIKDYIADTFYQALRVVTSETVAS
jgi:hypothetical protein